MEGKRKRWRGTMIRIGRERANTYGEEISKWKGMKERNKGRVKG